jgi:hypothetical protein
MESSLKKLEKYKEGVKEGVAVLLEKTFPEKILQLNELLQSEKFSINRLNTIHVSIQSEKFSINRLNTIHVSIQSAISQILSFLFIGQTYIYSSGIIIYFYLFRASPLYLFTSLVSSFILIYSERAHSIYSQAWRRRQDYGKGGLKISRKKCRRSQKRQKNRDNDEMDASQNHLRM